MTRSPLRAKLVVAALSALLMTAETQVATAAAPIPDGDVTIAAPATFTHPGVLVSRPRLEFMRTKVLANARLFSEGTRDPHTSPRTSA